MSHHVQFEIAMQGWARRAGPLASSPRPKAAASSSRTTRQAREPAPRGLPDSAHRLAIIDWEVPDETAHNEGASDEVRAAREAVQA